MIRTSLAFSFGVAAACGVASSGGGTGATTTTGGAAGSGGGTGATASTGGAAGSGGALPSGVGGSQGAQGGGGSGTTFPCGVGGSGVVTGTDAGCIACTPPSPGGVSQPVMAYAFSADKGCFDAVSTPLCTVCVGDGPCPDGGIAPGSHCIVGPSLETYYLVSQPAIWAVAPGWYVSDTLVGTFDVGAGAATPEQLARCAAVKSLLPVTPDDGGGFFPPSKPPVICN